jgi:hypothetical protein
MLTFQSSVIDVTVVNRLGFYIQIKYSMLKDLQYLLHQSSTIKLLVRIFKNYTVITQYSIYLTMIVMIIEAVLNICLKG